MEELKAFELCPLDGRYSDIKDKLSLYFSEYAYMKYRTFVEIEWLIYLYSKKVANISNSEYETIKDIYSNFDIQTYQKIKEEEKITNHDVKAIEYFIDKKLKECNLNRFIPFVHFGLTSEDINNTAYALMIKDFLNNCYYKDLNNIIKEIKEKMLLYKKIPFLAHTHGQPATPTTVGKEFKVYYYRLNEEIKKLKSIKIKGKFNGATGNYSALHLAYPELDVVSFSKYFIEEILKLNYNPYTTQIENHDYIVSILDEVRHINNIILDLDIDMWIYISKEYFSLKVIKEEVGSSTMPHKVNPINFENSEANLELANGLLVSLSNKLPRSRMQRDLSDSSALRNLGVAFGYSIQGIKENLKGMKKIIINKKYIYDELENQWEVLAEPIQTILRKYGIQDAYQQLKELTRGKRVDKSIIHDFIRTLDISEKDKNELLKLTPLTYIGLADKL